MSKTKTNIAAPDTLVPDPMVAQEFGDVTLMTLYRWDHDPKMIAQGWPPPVKIRKRNHRSRRALDAFKQKLVTQAVKDRAALLSDTAA
jgi:hypothetical protein